MGWRETGIPIFGSCSYSYQPLEGLEVETGALEGAALYPQKSPNGAVGDVAEP